MAVVGPKMMRSVPRLNHNDIEKHCDLLSFQNAHEDTHWANGCLETWLRDKLTICEAGSARTKHMHSLVSSDQVKREQRTM